MPLLSSLLHLPFPTPSPLPSLRPRRPRPHLILSSSSSQNTPRPRTPTLFPGGYKRPEIKIPTVVLRVGSEELRRDGAAAVETAVRVGWVGIVVVSGDGEGGGGGRLLEVVRRVMEVVGGRAYVVVEERVDVAAAVGAAGVLLSDNGLPAIVARNMMSKSSSEYVLLPLVGKTVLTAKQAVSASSTEGADFLVVETSAQNDGKMLEDFIGGVDVKIPIFFNIADVMGGDSGTGIMEKIPQFSASGLVLSLGDMEFFSNETFEKLFPNVPLNVRINHEANLNKDKDSEDHTEQKPMVAGFSRLQDETIQLMKEEKDVLHEAITIIRKAAPMMEEVSLLVDAVSRLDQPFLLVIVGEFNTGKSTVINTLLGRRYLKEGVVPTTNEITLLCYPDRASVEQERCERHPDGQFICYLSAPLLKQMNLVDTPGTNVILQRQQRLTEEYVPRADLVIFVLSSDRPLTESEVAFLRYIQQWKKRVVFLLNKSDMYRNASELEEAMEFIKLNVRKLLNTEEVIIYPVSARSAIEAKLSLCSDTDGINKALLNDPRWRSSGFYELENFLFSFLDGSTDRGMERMSLKLETPILIGDRLLAACTQMVKEDYELAVENLASVNDLVNSVKDYMVKLENESISWKKQIMILVETTKNRVVKLTESILRLSNVDLAVTYAFRGENPSSISAIRTVQNEIIDPALSDAQRLLEEYYQWLESSTSQESQQYVKSFVRKWPEFIRSEKQVHPEKLALVNKGEELSLKVTRNFSASAATKLFEQEIREVVFGTYGGLGVAGLSASLLTSVLPTTLEDLLALALCSTGGYIVISNFPARRKIAIEKISRVADTLSQEIEGAMQEDLSKATENLTSFVELISKPYKDAAQRQINRLSAIQCELNSVEEKLKELKTKIQNSHVS